MLILLAGGVAAASSLGARPEAAARQTTAPELQFDQAKRQFDAGDTDKAVPLLDALITTLAVGPQIQKADLLVQVYLLRARARYVQGNTLGTEQDFSALLSLNPGFRLPEGVSARVVAVFEAVRKVTIGQATISLTPAGDVTIDGKTRAVTTVPETIDLPAGEHQVDATRPGYRAHSEKFTIVAGENKVLPLVLERVSSTLEVVSIPDGAEVVLDGTVRGRTTRGTGTSEASAPLTISDLQPGAHRLLLRRECHKDVERVITIDQPGDFSVEPLRLTPAVATVQITTTEPGGVLFVDGVSRGAVPASATTVCEGAHVIEVRGPRGRFIDRREWKTGDNATLTADLRRAFAIVNAKSGSALTPDQLGVNVERVLATARRILVFVPVESDRAAAMAGESMPADWLLGDSIAAMSRVPKDVTREISRRLAGKLGAQGVAAVTGSADPYVVTVALLAPGSSEPDVMTINLGDAGSRTRALDAFGAAVPAFVRASIETSVIDVAGVQGAVVIRSTGAGAKAGLAAGDVIVAAGGKAIGSATDLRTTIAGLPPAATDLALEVKSPAGASRPVTTAVVKVPDTIPLRDPSILYNTALLDLEEAVKSASTPAGKFAGHVNVAIVHMRLADWEQALAELAQAQAPEGPGVSAGTVAYLSGLCYEAIGRAPDAQAAFTKAAAAPLARLWNEGPLVAPLARQKLGR